MAGKVVFWGKIFETEIWMIYTFFPEFPVFINCSVCECVLVISINQNEITDESSNVVILDVYYMEMLL